MIESHPSSRLKNRSGVGIAASFPGSSHSSSPATKNLEESKLQETTFISTWSVASFKRDLRGHEGRRLTRGRAIEFPYGKLRRVKKRIRCFFRILETVKFFDRPFELPRSSTASVRD